jgi:hypothetical protein
VASDGHFGLGRLLGTWQSGSLRRHILLVVYLVLWVFPTAQALRGILVVKPETSARDVANFLNNETPPGSRIETYESPLFLSLRRRYHYPPDPVQTQVNRRLSARSDAPVEYDALATDPDYLVLGPMSRLFTPYLYDPVLNAGHFRLLKKYGDYYGGYLVYERLR